jgi:hypothetical protein
MPMYELFVPKLLITTFGSPETGCYWTTLWNSDILEMGFLVGFFQLNLVGFSCPKKLVVSWKLLFIMFLGYFFLFSK